MYRQILSISYALAFIGVFYIFQGCSVNRAKNYSYRNHTDYETQRKSIVAGDSLRSFDADIALNENEKSASLRLSALRNSMLKYYNSINFFPPAKHFFKSKDHIYSTRLFALLKQMPKGGIHHLHPSAGISYHWIVDRAIREKDCYVFWDEPGLKFIKGQIGFFKEKDVPAGFQRAADLNRSVPGFPEKLYDLLTFDDSIMKDSVDIWKEFEYRFRRIEAFTSFQPVFEDMYTALFDSLAADGVQHVELRAHLGDKLFNLETTESYPADSMIRYINNALARTRRASDPGFTCKLVYTNVRFLPVTWIKTDLANAFRLKKQYPDLIKAYDLVAHEDAGFSTQYYLDAWLTADSLSKAYNISLPFCFHDGESDWQHLTNVYDAVMLNTVRLGHGFNLSFFPGAEDIIRRRQICVEVSPLSNQVLGYITDLRMHPAHSWIKHGIQISISPDDPSIFNYSGVTPDYWSIFLAWELDLRSLKKLAMNSITYSLLSESEKQTAMKSWKIKWNKFIDTMLKN